MPLGSLAFAPKIVYNGVTVALALPPVPWEPGSMGVGSSDVSGGGVMAAYEIRRDQTLDVVLRFYESEWPALRAWLEWGQRGNTFVYWLDKNDGASTHTCYLSSPLMGTILKPSRDNAQIGSYSLPIQIRDTSGTAFDYRITGL